MTHLLFCRLYSGASCAFFRVKYLVERKRHYCQNGDKFPIAKGRLALKSFKGYTGNIISLTNQGNV